MASIVVFECFFFIFFVLLFQMIVFSSWKNPPLHFITYPVVPPRHQTKFYCYPLAIAGHSELENPPIFQPENWLVVWNMNFIFPYVGNNNPNWLSYFSEGLKPPTRKSTECHIDQAEKSPFVLRGAGAMKKMSHGIGLFSQYWIIIGLEIIFSWDICIYIHIHT